MKLPLDRHLSRGNLDYPVWGKILYPVQCQSLSWKVPSFDTILIFPIPLPKMLFQCFREFLFSPDPTIFHHCMTFLASVTVFVPVFVSVFVTWQRNGEIPYAARDSGANSGTALPQHSLNSGPDPVPVFAPVLVFNSCLTPIERNLQRLTLWMSWIATKASCN